MRELADTGRYEDDVEELKEVEKAINETGDECARTQLKEEYARLKRALEREKKSDSEELERLRLLERQINMQLQAEMPRLADLENQLDELEREVAEQIAEAEKGERWKIMNCNCSDHMEHAMLYRALQLSSGITTPVSENSL